MIVGLAYVVYMALVMFGLGRARQIVLDEYSTPQAQEQWRQWKRETERQAQQPEGPARRAVGIVEPPGLVLMRDRFGTITLGTVLTATFVFVFMAFIVRGILMPGTAQTTTSDTAPPASPDLDHG